MTHLLGTPNGISGGTLELVLVILAIIVLLFFLIGGRWRR